MAEGGGKNLCSCCAFTESQRTNLAPLILEVVERNGQSGSAGSAVGRVPSTPASGGGGEVSGSEGGGCDGGGDDGGGRDGGGGELCSTCATCAHAATPPQPLLAALTSALHLLTFATPPFPCYILGELYDEHFDAFVTPLKDIEGALASSRTRARAGRAARAPRGGPAQAKEVRCLPPPPPPASTRPQRPYPLLTSQPGGLR